MTKREWVIEPMVLAKTVRAGDNRGVPTQVQALTVSELNSLIKEALSLHLPEQVWVQGELKDLYCSRNGHRYFDLLEVKEGQTKAKIACCLFASDYARFIIRLKELKMDNFLQNDIEVCVLGEVDYYEPTGKVSLIVRDIDPFFTLGKLTKEKEKVRALLQKQGLYDRNKSKKMPPVPLKVGLITAEGSAAERDFLKELGSSGLAFRVILAHALMQGKETEVEVVQAIEKLEKANLDVICIVRGGGSFTDLAFFDAFGIAKAIACSPVPVVTGIGHEKDISLSDEVAHTSCKTPTKAAQFLVEQVQSFLHRVENSFYLILKQADRLLMKREELLSSTAGAIRQRSIQMLHFHQMMLQTRSHQLASTTEKFLQGRTQAIELASLRVRQQAKEMLKDRARNLIHCQKALSIGKLSPLFLTCQRRLELAMKSLLLEARHKIGVKQNQLELAFARASSFDVEKVLEKGFVLVRQKKLVKRKSAFHPEKPFSLQFFDGTVGITPSSEK